MADDIAALRKALATSQRRNERQAAEIAGLKKQAAKPRRSIIRTVLLRPEGEETDALVARNIHAFRFLDLAAEMRGMVYDLCLDVGKVFVRPRSEHDHRYRNIHDYEKPVWELLGVCKQIRAEAAHLFFLRNQFVLSHEHDAWRVITGWPLESSLALSPRVALSRYVRQHLSSVSITLDLRGLTKSPLYLAGFVRDHCEEALNDGRVEDPFCPEWMATAHEGIGEYTGQWERVCRYIAGPKLRNLEVNIANCYCPLGCCRLVYDAIHSVRLANSYSSLECLRIVGVLNPDERETVMDVLTDSEDSTVLHVGQELRLEIPAMQQLDLAGINWPDWEEEGMGDRTVDLRATVEMRKEGLDKLVA